MAEAALVFAALGDPTRLALVRRLCAGGPASISVLAESFHVSRQAITKHLQVLAVSGIIDGTRSGRQHVWQLNPDRIADARCCLETIARAWDDALGRLKARLEQR